MSDLLRENRVKDLFNEALDLDEESRAALLDRAAADDPSVQIEVRVLINAHERAGDFLVEPAAPATPALPAGEKPGDTIGRYKLLQLIGEGGFGRVYMAEQREPVIRRVALKIIKAGMDTQQVIARFEAERQALALMDHRNIATVYDAGATAAGRPYFVMELVRGVPITQYCDEHVLTIEQRLELFGEVCSAVQHAHTKGIIHRDIKPSNVMVTIQDDRSVTKIIDFGIAKATSARLTEKTLFTEFRQLIGTPEYMSPEQADANSSDVDTRSDVYSLGVLMYELLTGATPFDGKRLRSAAFGELQRIIREEDPPKPSTRLSTLETLPSIAAQRALEPRRLTIHLRGDLDWITLKALDKSRERRYGSAAELAEDIRRHFRNEPVLAGPPSAAYRARKFMRRHRVGVLATSLIAFTVVAGAIGTTVGMLHARASAKRAGDAAQQASAVNDFMREVLTSANPEQRGADVRLVEVLGAASATASQRFAGYPEMEAQVRDLLGSVYQRLWLARQCADEFGRALTLWQSSVGPDDPRTLNTTLALGQTLVSQERGREADELLRGILPRLDRCFGPDHAKSFEGRGIVADLLRIRGQLDESERMLNDAIQRAAAIGISDSIQVRLRNALTGTLRQKIENVDPSLRDAAVDECVASASQLLEQGARLGAEGEWFTFTARQNLANLALLRGEFVEASAQCRQLLDESRDRLTECHNIRIWAMITLANAQARLGETREPADLYLRLTACVRATMGSDGIPLISHLSDALAFLDRDERWAEGEACAREIIQMLHATGGHVGTYAYETRLADFISEQGRLDEADLLYQSLLTREAEASNAYERGCMNVYYASHLTRRGDFEQAERLLQQVRDSGDLSVGTVPVHYPDDLVYEFIALYDAWGKAEKAEEYRRLFQEKRQSASP